MKQDLGRYTPVLMPRYLDIFGQHDEMCNALNTLAALVYRRGVPAVVDFSQVSGAHPAGILATGASIHAARAFRGNSDVTGTYPIDKDSAQILQAAGFFDLLKVKHLTANRPAGGNERWIKPITNTQCLGQSVEQLHHSIFADEPTIDEFTYAQMYIGLTEGMANVVQHAYPKDELRAVTPFIEDRWWLSGHLNRMRRELTFCICDLGIGIPKTISKKVAEHRREDSIAFLESESSTDPALIRLALMEGGTRTDLPWRGKGLRQMRAVVDEIGGRVRIASGFGACHYQAGRCVESAFPLPLTGTVVEWTIPLRPTKKGRR